MSNPVSAAPAAPSAPAASSSPSPSSSSSSSPSAGVPSTSAPSANIPSASASAESKPSQNTPDQAAQAAAQAAEVKKWKLKAQDKEIELTEQELVRRAQLGLGADAKFQEAAQMRKSAEALFEALRSNPLEVLTNPQLGLNFRELAEQYLAGELQNEMLSPEQRELKQLREWREKQEAEAEARRQSEMTAAQQQEFQRHMERAAKEYDTKISEVLADSGLPKTAYTVKRVAELLKGALQKGYDLDVRTAVDMVRETYNGDFRSMFGGLKGESLVKFLGDDVLREIRQHDLARIKAKLEGQAVPAPAAAETPAPSSEKFQRQKDNEPRQMKQNEWLEAIRKKAGV